MQIVNKKKWVKKFFLTIFFIKVQIVTLMKFQTLVKLI